MKKIVSILMAVAVVSTLCLSVCAIDADNGYGISIDSDSNGYFDSTRIFSRMSKMQAYTYPSYIYYEDEVLGELSTTLTYSQVNMPMYFNSVPELSDGTYANITSIGTSTAYSGSGTVNYQYTYCLYPSIYRDVDSINLFTYRLSTDPNSLLQNPSSRHMLHGTTYGYYDENQNTYGMAISNVHSIAEGANVVVSISGTIEVYADLGVKIGDNWQFTYDSKDINTNVILGPGESINIDWSLIKGYNVTETYTAISRFVGTIVIGYGANAVRYSTINEYIPNLFSEVVKYDSTAGLTTIEGEDFDGIVGDWVTPETYWDRYVKAYANSTDGQLAPSGTINITSNGTYNVASYASAVVNVEQNLAWSGLWDWLFDSVGALMEFEIAPDWSIGTIMTIIVGIGIAIWVIRVFMGG